MRTGVLFTAFPQDVILKTKNELCKYGIEITEVYNLDRQKDYRRILERSELIFIHHSLTSHTKTVNLQRMARLVGKSKQREVFYLPHKTSMWGKILGRFSKIA